MSNAPLPFIWPPLPEFPAIVIRGAHWPHRGGVDMLLTPGRLTVTLDEHRLTPEEACALGLAIGNAIGSADKQESWFPAGDSAGDHAGVSVSAFVLAGAATIYLETGGERRTLWQGPREDAHSIALALCIAGRGALDLEAYTLRPVYIITPISPTQQLEPGAPMN